MNTLRKILMMMLLGVLLTLALPAEAQCPMCRASASSSLEDGATVARGLNKGILYLFITPYLIVGTIGFFWWRANRKPKMDDHLISELAN